MVHLDLLEKLFCMKTCQHNCRLGFSVLLHGLGSKKALLEDFRVSHLSEELHLVVNGFFPSITLKSVGRNTILTVFLSQIPEHPCAFITDLKCSDM